MNSKGFTEIHAIVCLIICMLLFIFAVVFVQATMESKTYNKLTGAQTTWWDALWVELRVQAPTR